MRLDHKDVKVLSSERYDINIDHWNAIQNRYEIKCTDREMHYPKWLLLRVIEEFNRQAESYHIDASKFPFVEITGQDCTWQVDFHTESERRTGPRFSVYDIFYNSKTKQIMQSCFSLT